MPATRRQLAAIMFTDIAGYTALMGANEQRALQVLEIVRNTIKPLVQKHEGKWQKEIGDGSLSSFHSAVDAVQCALEVQKQLAGQDFKMRIGVHVGEVAFTEDDIFGDGVNIASRIEPLAPPGGIYITGRVYEDIVNKPDLKAAYVGERTLKNVNRPISIYTLYGEGLPEPPKQPATNRPGDFIRDIWHRRLPQILLIYLFASWTIIQLIKWASAQFMWSPNLTGFASVLLLTLVPSVGLIAYYHGRAGMEKWVGAERIVVPVNLLLTLLVLFFMFRNRDLGSTTTEVTVEDEKGNIVQKAIPKGEYVHNLAIFNFENRQSDEEMAWLSTGIQLALQVDLEQDQFIRVKGTEAFMDDFRKNKIEHFDQLPFQLLLSIARTYRMDHFLTGSYEISGEEYLIDAQLYEVQNGKLVAERTHSGSNLTSLIDAMTLAVKEDLGISTLQIEEEQDLAVSVLLTKSLPALKAYSQGYEAATFYQDYPKSIAHFQEAAAIDPDMAIADLQLGSIYVMTNQLTKSKTRIQQVMDKLYMLPEKDQYIAKAIYYYLNEDHEKRTRVLEMMRELYPRDITAYNYLRQIYTITGQPAKAEEVLRDALKYDDNRGNFYVNMADVLMIQGKKEEAKRYYQLYADIYPGHERSFRLLGNYHFEEGNYEEAEKNYDKSILLSDGYTESISKMALIRGRQGKFEEAAKNFVQAMRLANTANDSMSVMDARMDFLLNRGRIREVIDTWNDFLATAKSVMPPINISISRITRLWWYFLIDQDEKALQVIKKEEPSFNDSFKGLLSFGYIIYFLNVEDLTKAKEEYEKIIAHTARFGSPGSIEIYYEGEIAVLEGDFEKALEKFQEFEKVNAFFQKDLLAIKIADCDFQLGKVREAMDRLEHMIHIDPYNARAHYELAKILIHENKSAEALNHLEAANDIWIAADPDYIYAQDARRLAQHL